jgi:cobalt-zinc-cadmium efflux system outer membrane protein
MVAGLGWVLAAATPARAQTDTNGSPGALVLTRHAAIDSVLARNPQLEAARQQVFQAKARVTQARAIPDLGLSYSVSDERTLFHPGRDVTNEFDVGAVIPFPSRLILQGKVAGADVKSAQFSYLQLRQYLAAQAVQVYDSILVATRHAADLKESRELAAQFVTRTEARFNGGTAPKLDVIKAKVDLAQAENDLIATERDIANANASLNRLLGRPLGAELQLADSLGLPAELPDLARLERQADSLRPELRSLQAQQAGARAATSLANQYWLPDIALTVGRLGGAGTPTSWTTGIGIGFPLFFWQHHHGEIAEARHRELELTAVQTDLVAQIGQEVRTAYSGASTALRQVVYLRDELLPEAREAFRIATVSYGLGGSSTLEVLDARRTLIDAESQYADALGALNDAVAQLELAVGGPLDGSQTGDQHGN